jgi:TonB family protein
MPEVSKLLGVLAIAAAMSGFSPAQAQRPARGGVPGIDLPAGRWNVEYGRARCTLTRRIAGEGSPVLIVSMKNSGEYAEVMLVTDRGGVLPRLPTRAQMALLPNGTSADVRVQPYPGYEQRAARIQGVPPTFVEELASASGLRISGRTVGLTVEMLDTQQAVAAVRACNRDLKRSWGINVDQQALVTREPVKVAGSFSSNDYPAEALARSQVGTTLVRVTVGPDGKAGDCRIIFTSRAPLLDATTCRVMTTRFRYEPALDAQGQPVAFMVVQSVQWGIADDGVDGFFFGTDFALPATGIAN